MPIHIECGSCGKKLNVADSAAGKRGKCPGCGSVVQVPAAAQVPAPRRSADVQPVQDVAVQRVEAAPPLPAIGAPTTNVQATSVTVNTERRTSSLGVVSLILGIVAFLICWIPVLGMLGIPLSGLGLLLGIVGLLVAIFRKGTGIGFPIGGSAICALALVVAVSQAFVIGAAATATAGAVTATAQEFAEAAQQQTRTNQETVASSSDKRDARMERERPAPDKREAPEPAPQVDRQAEKPKEPKWASAESPVKQGDIEMQVISVSVGKIPLKAGYDESARTSKDELLAIELKLTNRSRTKKVEYSTWMGRDFTLSRDSATLGDNFGNRYKRIDFGFGATVVGRTDADSIYPGKTLVDVLVFELPIDSVEHLNLELPAKNFGGTGMLRVRIPARMIEQRQ